MRKVARKIEVLDLINRFPSKTNKEIALATDCNRLTVAKYRKDIDMKYDDEFVKIVAGKFIKAYGRAEEYWTKQIDRLEELKNNTYKIHDEKTGDVEEVSLTPMEILAIEKHQSDLHEKILYLASQGEVRQVIRIMRMGKLPMLGDNTGDNDS